MTRPLDPAPAEDRWNASKALDILIVGLLAVSAVMFAVLVMAS